MVLVVEHSQSKHSQPLLAPGSDDGRRVRSTVAEFATPAEPRRARRMPGEGVRAPPGVTLPRPSQVISECHESMLERQLDREGKHVINEGVEDFVQKWTYGQMGDALELVVDVDLRDHSCESQ